MSRPPTRQNEILTLLARYGVMSTTTLTQLMSSKISDSWLRESLYILQKRNLVRRGTILLRGRPSQYWTLGNSPKIMEHTMQRTGLNESQMRDKSAHWSSFPHEDLCTIFQASVERQMPSVCILRESTNNFKTLPDHLLSERVKQNGYIPDMCLGIPTRFSKAPISDKGYRWIAVEIDRTHRSHKRMAARANIYTRHTSFAGLLYFMPDERSAHLVTKIYRSRGAASSSRITGGTDSFLATSCVPKSIFDVNTLLVNCGEFELPLPTWLALFSVCETHKRDAALVEFSSNTQGLNIKRAI